MAYTKTTWIDRVVEFANRYKDQSNNVLTLTRDAGTITQAGTPVNATNMNKIENKLYDLDLDDLTQYKRAVITIDAYGNPIIIYFKRYDTTLFMSRTYSNINSEFRYLTCVEKTYGADGTTLIKTITYTFTYLSNGCFDTIERVVA